MIKVLVSWEIEDEIKKALEIYSKIHELLDSLGLHSGTSTTNDPPKTFGLHIKEKAKTEIKPKCPQCANDGIRMMVEVPDGLQLWACRKCNNQWLKES